MKYHKNDEVLVTAGKNKGNRGKIEQVLPKLSQVIVGGLNLYKRHTKGRAGQPGGMIDVAKPLSVAKIALVCPNCQQPTRVGWVQKGDKKTRVCRKCQGVFVS